MADRVIGVLGGSGIYDLEGLTNVEEVAVETPFGPPSDRILTGELGDARLAFLARHGRGHRVLPHEINYRANIFALKSLGVEWLISLSAVGSMKEEIRPGDMVIVDQFFDRTSGRVSTFFGDEIAGHIGFADPVSPVLADCLHRAASEVMATHGNDQRVHRGGTYIVINGPQFSTRAESRVYRSWGVDVIGMTNIPEAKLAREAEISYATVALATDYDCWHEDHDDVSVEAVVAILKQNAERARQVVRKAIALVPEKHECIASRALENAIMTHPEAIPASTREKLAPIIGKYFGAS
jgi:5'-methylthioadenosine phosphorylase